MLSELKSLIERRIQELHKDTHGHIGLELGIRLKTLRWVLSEIDKMENNNA